MLQTVLDQPVHRVNPHKPPRRCFHTSCPSKGGECRNDFGLLCRVCKKDLPRIIVLTHEGEGEKQQGAEAHRNEVP